LLLIHSFINFDATKIDFISQYAKRFANLFLKMQIMTKKERLEAIITHYSNGKPSVFAKHLGVAPSTISSWLSRDTLDYDLIFAKCENISSDWLLTGKGEMIKSNPNIQILNEPKAVEKTLDEQEVLLYDVTAAANLRTLFDNKRQNILGKISIPNMPKCDGAVYVNGDSMYPLLKSGDIVVYKETRDFSDVIYGEMYLVSFDLGGDDYLAVKYVNRSEKEGYIKLVSYNTHHEPKDIRIDKIRALALVKLSIRKNTMI
jgi:phage repressor protein C with HTH and peptisase S24 domain